MGDFPHYFDIILFAMVAAFLVLRLRSVLGRRTGNERRRTGGVRQAGPTGDKEIAFGQRGNGAAPPPATEPPADAVAAGGPRRPDPPRRPAPAPTLAEPRRPGGEHAVGLSHSGGPTGVDGLVGRMGIAARAVPGSELILDPKPPQQSTAIE